MRRLILMRHAKAERGSPTGEDFDRPLSPRGEEDAALMGQVLARAGLSPDFGLVSSAERTRQTWALAAQSFPGAKARLTRALYHADPDALLEEIGAEGEAETLMVVGHNPGIHALALRLLAWSAAPPSVSARFDHGFPTATAAVFQLDEAGRAHYDGLFLVAEHGGRGGE